MTKLEELRQQKKELELKIKQLENADFLKIGEAKIDKEHYATDKPDRYYVAIRIWLPDSNKWVWRSISSGEDKKAVIARLPILIGDLQKLFDELAKETSK